MKTTIIFGLIGILFVLMFLGYWKMSTRFESIEQRLIKIQDNLPTTPITTTTATATTTTTTTAITTTEKEEFGPKSCNDVDDVMAWLKCEKSHDRRKHRTGVIMTLASVGFIIAFVCVCSCCASARKKEKERRARNLTYKLVDDRVLFYSETTRYPATVYPTRGIWTRTSLQPGTS